MAFLLLDPAIIGVFFKFFYNSIRQVKQKPQGMNLINVYSSGSMSSYQTPSLHNSNQLEAKPYPNTPLQITTHSSSPTTLKNQTFFTPPQAAVTIYASVAELYQQIKISSEDGPETAWNQTAHNTHRLYTFFFPMSPTNCVHQTPF